jgi:hypothetical protein
MTAGETSARATILATVTASSVLISSVIPLFFHHFPGWLAFFVAQHWVGRGAGQIQGLD